jgi:hypothetical protein
MCSSKKNIIFSVDSLTMFFKNRSIPFYLFSLYIPKSYAVVTAEQLFRPFLVMIKSIIEFCIIGIYWAVVLSVIGCFILALRKRLTWSWFMIVFCCAVGVSQLDTIVEFLVGSSSGELSRRALQGLR